MQTFVRVSATFLAMLVVSHAFAQSTQPKPKSQAKPSQKSQSAATPLSVDRTPVPPVLTSEHAFYYWVAVYGSPKDVVDRYAREFDPVNYKRAMADEFERGRYRSAIETHISKMVGALSFAARFTYVSRFEPRNGSTFGEYDFSARSFPVRRPDTGFDYLRYDAGFQINPFDLAHALNVRDFSWRLPMDEKTAKSFLTNHSDRQLVLRFVYSVTPYKREVHSSRYYFTSFIHSVEVFADRELSKLVAKLSRADGTPGTWRDAQTLEPGTKTLYYKERYSAYWGTDGLSPSKAGELPLADGAQYSRVLEFGTTAVRAKDYYITGELEMEGEFIAVCEDEDQELCAHGQFTWYHKNGVVRQKETFKQGKEVPYCTESYVARFALMWDETGKCKTRSTSKCPCVDQPSEAASANVGSSSVSATENDPTGMYVSSVNDPARMVAIQGRYVRKGASADFLELRADGTSALVQDGFTIRGNYAVQNDTVTLVSPDMPGQVSSGIISGDTIKDSDGNVWQKLTEDQRAAAPPVPQQSAGSENAAASLVGKYIAKGIAYYLQLNPDGTVSCGHLDGSAPRDDCGTYKVLGPGVSLKVANNRPTNLKIKGNSLVGKTQVWEKQ